MSIDPVMSIEIDRCREVGKRVEAILKRLCHAKTYQQAIDLAYDARGELAMLPGALSRIEHPPQEKACPSPVDAILWANRKPSGNLQD